MTDSTTNVWATGCEPFDYSMPSDQVVKVSDALSTTLKRYIGADVGTIYLQENSEVTIVLGKGSKIHIVNEGEKE